MSDGFIKWPLTRSDHEDLGRPAMYRGVGGAIPFMSILDGRFPRA
jgi:hypothetical protein